MPRRPARLTIIVDDSAAQQKLADEQHLIAIAAFDAEIAEWQRLDREWRRGL